MGKQPTDPTPEALLAELRRIRALARSLLADSPDVDDVVQDAWIAATVNPPRDPRSLRPWLRRAVSNLVGSGARGAQRRTLHEASADQPAGAPAGDELFERAQAQHLLAAFVPGRDAVSPHRRPGALRERARRRRDRRHPLTHEPIRP